MTSWKIGESVRLNKKDILENIIARSHDYETDKICDNECGEYATEDSGLCEECDLATYDCKECKDTGIITVIHGEDSSEWEEEFGCECHDDPNEGITR
jgi:hypothetical protein